MESDKFISAAEKVLKFQIIPHYPRFRAGLIFPVKPLTFFFFSKHLSGVYYLERLNLRGNPLGQLPDNVITHPFMRFLRHLDLSSCELTEMGKDSVDDLRDLMILDLSDNKLSSIHADTFKVGLG